MNRNIKPFRAMLYVGGSSPCTRCHRIVSLQEHTGVVSVYLSALSPAVALPVLVLYHFLDHLYSVTGTAVRTAAATCTCCRRGRWCTLWRGWWCCTTWRSRRSGTTTDTPTTSSGEPRQVSLVACTWEWGNQMVLLPVLYRKCINSG